MNRSNDTQETSGGQAKLIHAEFNMAVAAAARGACGETIDACRCYDANICDHDNFVHAVYACVGGKTMESLA